MQRIRQGLQAGRDIHAVAEDVFVLDDDVAEVDPDAEPDPPVLRRTGLAIASALRFAALRET